MDTTTYFNNLNTPKGKIDVILDTDAFNEIDDQFAISYMLKNGDRINVKGICAAPFHFYKSATTPTPDIGMEQSYNEILKILDLSDYSQLKSKVYRGSTAFLSDEKTAVDSPAADFIANTANDYSPEKPLYIVAIGAITNVASAILKNPKIKENAVVVWLGGCATHIARGAFEYNMHQDIAAARVVMGCGVPFVQLPCAGVVDIFATTGPELTYWLKDKNKLCDYLLENTVSYAEKYAKGKPWSRVIWDVTAIAWLINDDNRFMCDRLIPAPTPQYDWEYSLNPDSHLIKYVHKIHRDALFEDLFKKLAE